MPINPDMHGSTTQPGLRCHHGLGGSIDHPDCCHGPYLVLWSYCSYVLGWRPWLLLPQVATQMPVVWTVSHLRPCTYPKTLLLLGPCRSGRPVLPPGPWWHLAQAATEGQVWVYIRDAAEVWDDVHGQCCYRGVIGNMRVEIQEMCWANPAHHCPFSFVGHSCRKPGLIPHRRAVPLPWYSEEMAAHLTTGVKELA